MTTDFPSSPQIFVLSDFTTNHQDFLTEYLQKKGVPLAQINFLNSERGENRTLTIEMVRELISVSVQNYQPVHYLLLHLESASLEAQQALLKILEEPPENTFIYLTTLNLESILPTIKSRCQIIINANNNLNIDNNFDTIINQFDLFNIKNNSEGQIINQIETTLKSLVEKQKEAQVDSEAETASSLEREAVKVLLSQLTQKYLSQLSSSQTPADLKPLLVFSLEQLQQALLYNLANVNSKLLLEDLFFKIKAQA